MARIRAPEFPAGSTWLNSQPLKLREFRGHYVLLDFWTYGCINCINVIPKLAQLAAQFPELPVISIHTGKFDQENDSSSIAQAVERFAIHHPVVIDRKRTIWDNYAIRAYPTFVLVDPQGYIVLMRAGETGLVAIHEALRARLTADNLTLAPRAITSETPLRFPSKLINSDEQLFISDTGHHRIIVTAMPDHAGLISESPLSIGNGQPGYVDGHFLEAQFSAPQGLVLNPHNNCLMVADTGNHIIRRIDFTTQKVDTIAGTGQQSAVIYPHGGKALSTSLNSPWDLVLINQTLFIAMAGNHQIWQLDLSHGTISTFAGSGAEGCFDGSPEIAAFAQPSGITTDGEMLYVADCESSSIRQIDITTGHTETICGSGNLYVFGDRDGIGEAAQLQHPMGLTYRNETLWITDTYNHKIKRLDLKTRQCRTIATDFSEPTGVTTNANGLIVANTNQHQLQVLRNNSPTPTPIKLTGLCPPEGCIRSTS